ncbi:MAG: STAS domain-containing protein [Microcystaceae cyanobacterium]
MELTDQQYRIFHDEETATIHFQGSLRLSGMADYAPIVELLNQVKEQKPETITLNLEQLNFLNSSGISMLSKFVINIRKTGHSQIIIQGSNNIPWQGKSLKNLQRLMPNLVLELI